MYTKDFTITPLQAWTSASKDLSLPPAVTTIALFEFGTTKTLAASYFECSTSK